MESTAQDEIPDVLDSELSQQMTVVMNDEGGWLEDASYADYQEAQYKQFRDEMRKKHKGKKRWQSLSSKWKTVYALRGDSALDLHAQAAKENQEHGLVDGYSTEYCRVSQSDVGVEYDRETVQACKEIHASLALRTKYAEVSRAPVEGVSSASELTASFDGSSFVLEDGTGKVVAQPTPLTDFMEDVASVMGAHGSGVVTSFAKRQLGSLSTKFALYNMLNDNLELEATRNDPRDFFNVYKVDGNVHLTSCMTSQHLTDFIRRKVQECGDDVVLLRANGQEEVTLAQVAESLHLDTEGITVDSLDVMADQTLFRRFDRFNEKLNPCGHPELREIFMKTHNHIGGRYLAELVREVIDGLEANQQHAMFKVSVYGRHPEEWDQVAHWVVDNNLLSECVTWCVQVPRLFSTLQAEAETEVQCFADVLRNLFQPLLDVTLHPESNETLATFVSMLGSFDCVDDESKYEYHFTRDRMPPSPIEWTMSTNPPFLYYMYHLWANLTTVNRARVLQGQRAIELVPHAGMAGNLNHLGTAFLLCDGVNHGVQLSNSAVLEYLFYLAQVPIAMSPLANNSIFVSYQNNPFRSMFDRGLNVSLATDDPLQFHYTPRPLMEEYSVAAQVWKMNQVDLSEVARNSVASAPISDTLKAAKLGPNWAKGGVQGNDVAYSNLPNVRVAFRQHNLEDELNLIQRVADDEVGTGGGSSSSSSSGSSSSDSSESVRVVVADAEYATRREDHESASMLLDALAKRRKYMLQDKSVVEDEAELARYGYAMVDGVHQITLDGKPVSELDDDEGDQVGAGCRVTPLFEFLDDLQLLQHMCLDGPVKSYSYRRMKFLDHVWTLHVNWNAEQEKREQAAFQRDFYNVTKVDNHVHLASAMTARQLMRFIKNKVVEEGDTVVYTDKASGEDMTLQALFESIGVPLEAFNVATMDVMADRSTFQRFDRFNAKYSPAGNSAMREVFMKTGNKIGGRYFAEVTRTMLDTLEENGSSMAEYRISIYGKSPSEWDKLADWVVDNKLYSTHNRFMIQFPRLFSILKDVMHAVSNFEEMMSHVFEPLFAVTLDPSSNPKLATLLEHISGFDSVDDESKLERQPNRFNVPERAREWTMSENPPYNYYLYYLWANTRTLNRLRAMRGLNTFDIRPHSGEAGHPGHLSGCFFLADGINHGIKLHLSPTLQYLYYLAQIGVAVSPLSNNSLFLEYKANPFPKFFRRGLNVSLTTDDPLQFHFTEQPLVEEYSVAAQVWKLSNVDVCEIAQNSVVQSGLTTATKKKLLGEDFEREFDALPTGVDASMTSVPPCRQQYRAETLARELETLRALDGSEE